MSPAIRVRPRRELRAARRTRQHGCWGHLIAAPLWPLHGANLGTLLRTCDAVGACLAVPPFRWVDEALARGNTLRRPSCVHRVGSPSHWLAAERAAGARIVGVELADEAIRLGDLPAARGRTVVLLGHEANGLPPEALDALDVAVEIRRPPLTRPHPPRSCTCCPGIPDVSREARAQSARSREAGRSWWVRRRRWGGTGR